MGFVLSALHISSIRNLTTILLGRYYQCPRVAYKETETKRDYMTCPLVIMISIFFCLNNLRHLIRNNFYDLEPHICWMIFTFLAFISE